MLPNAVLVLATLCVSILAYPLNLTLTHSRSLVNRSAPGVDPSLYTPDQIQQINQAHRNAIELATSVVTYSDAKHANWFDRIFERYFILADKRAVADVFRRIIGPDGDPEGDMMLGQIEHVAEIEEDDQMKTCDPSRDPPVLATLYRPANEYPWIVTCAGAFAYGSIGGSDLVGGPEVACDTIYSPAARISRRMVTLGHIMLHEYMHWDKVPSPVTSPVWNFDHIEDVVYGPYEARRITYEQARRNSDTYAWLATEVFWRVTCEGSHGVLREPWAKDN